MTEAIVVANGVTYRGNGAERTITPGDRLSALAMSIMGTGAPVGPGVDEFAGVRATWDQYPLSMVCTFLTIADERPDQCDVTWYADDGTPAPEPAATEA